MGIEGTGRTPTRADVLGSIVANEPGLSAEDIFYELTGDERGSYASPRSLERALRSLSNHVHQRNGLWYPGPAPHRADEREAARLAPATDPFTDLEQRLRDRLRGRRLVAEVGLDTDLFEAVTDATRQLAVRGGMERFARLYPFTFMTFLVGHGVYGYQHGNYWGTMPVVGIDNAAGPIFARTCVKHGLEDFDLLVEQDNATRYVGRILAHGGIPRYCLDDFFTLVIKDMQRVGASADELLAHWRTKKTAFFQVDKPVGRFLLYGGDLAVDLLDRCLSAIIDAREAGRLPTADEAGLPPYLLAELRHHLEEISSISTRRIRHSDAIRPELVFEPYSPLGPELRLPPVHSESATEWRLWSARGVEDVTTSSFETKHLYVPPAKVWHLELRRHGESTREWSIEAFDSAPAIFFDTAGRALTTARTIRGDGVWALAPADVSYSVIDLSGTASKAHDVRELPDMSGSWSGYVARYLDLRDVSLLLATRDGSTTRLRVQPEASRPRVEDEPIPRIATTDGRPVFASLPTLVLPQIQGMEPSLWQIRVTIDGSVRSPQADRSLRVDLRSPSDPTIVKEARLRVRGPLGIDFRLEFAVVRDLQVTVPDRLLFPGDRHAPVAVNAPSVSVGDGQPGETTKLGLATDGSPTTRLTSAEGSIDLVVDVPRLMWAAIGSRPTAVTYTDRAITMGSHEVIEQTVTSLAVQTGTHDLPLELQLYVAGKLRQASDKVRTGGLEGRWAFDLAPFRGTLDSTVGALADFVLLVGQRPVTVLRLRPSVGVDAIDVSSRTVGDQTFVALAYRSLSVVQHRVVRFWPLDRPWASAVQCALPEQKQPGSEHVDIVQDIDVLPPGGYLVEVEIDDGWTVPARPRTRTPNTTVTVIGRREERMDALRCGDGVAILERALVTGHIARRLEEHELREVAPAALRALHLWALDPDRGLRAPKGISAVSSLLVASTNSLVRAVNTAAAGGLLDARAACRLGLLLMRDLRADASDAIDDEELRPLWSTAPVLAARLDLIADANPERESRLREALNWAPSQGTSALLTGEPVDQHFAGLPPERLVALRSEIDLVPKAVLDIDTLVAANFEWLIAASSGECNIESFVAEWARRLRPPVVVTETMRCHLAKREPPAGTVTWAGFPALTLSAALVLVSNPGYHDANDLLWEASVFAPRLVVRDLVLATALDLYAPHDPSRDEL